MPGTQPRPDESQRDGQWLTQPAVQRRPRPKRSLGSSSRLLCKKEQQDAIHECDKVLHRRQVRAFDLFAFHVGPGHARQRDAPRKHLGRGPDRARADHRRLWKRRFPRLHDQRLVDEHYV